MDGRQQLADLIVGNGRQAQLAREVGCSESHLSLLLQGKRWASPALAKKLSQAIDGKIPARALVSEKATEAADLLEAG